MNYNYIFLCLFIYYLTIFILFYYLVSILGLYTLAVLTTPHVPQEEAHEGCRDKFMRGLRHRFPVNYCC
jgi:hypothetical protein